MTEPSTEDAAARVRRWMAEPSPKRGLTMEELTAVCDQVERLRADLGRARAVSMPMVRAFEDRTVAGDALAAAAAAMRGRLWSTCSGTFAEAERVALKSAEDDWRSARGAAPAEPPAAIGDDETVPCCRATGYELREGDGHRFGCEPEERAADPGAPRPAEDVVYLAGDDIGALRVCEPPTPLPVTLSSVDDVAAVAVSYGLELRAGPLPTWDDPQGRVRVVVEKDGWRIGMRVIIHGHDGDRFIATGPRIALAPVQAAIEAARGGSR